MTGATGGGAVPLLSAHQFAQQHFGLGGQCVGSIHIARGKRLTGLLEEIPDMRCCFLLQVAQSSIDPIQPTLGGRNRA